jgi:NADH:ubiquinone oxidoreductase subunit K
MTRKNVTEGLYGVLTRRNILGIFMSIELMFNAANINFVAFNHFRYPGNLWGHGFVVFIITLAADKFTGFNYGFLLHKPEAKTLLNLLSDNHALYLFEMHLLALAFFVVLYLPFATYDLARRKTKYA